MQIVIVSPALAGANNGNWRTAQRWTRFLAPLGRVRVTTHWPDSEAAGDDVMLALHARRSAAAIRAWHELHETGHIHEQEHQEDGVLIHGRFPASQAGFFAPFVVKKSR